MTKPTIADVLHYAADVELPLFGVKRLRKMSGGYSHSVEGYSCDAILRSTDKWYSTIHDQDIMYDRIITGLQNLGLATYSRYVYSDINDHRERQEVRYAWLKFAALLAEEQGV